MNLTDLGLGFNQLSALPSQIRYLTDLDGLRLSSNRFTELPPEISDLSSLRQLTLTSNQLSNLPADISRLRDLENLHLEDNRLTGLPAEIGDLRALRSLRLDENQMANLPTQVRHLSALRNLNLSRNRLAHIDINSLPQNRHLTIDLTSNLFSGATVASLNQAQNQEAYSGPRLSLSVVSSQPTQDLTARNIKEVLTKLGHNSDHPLWVSLEQRSQMGDVANDFTLLLARIYNDAPRENNQLTGRITEHLTRVLTTLEQLHDQSEPEKIETILNNAHGAVATCVDRAAIHVLLMSAQSHYYQSGDQRALADINTINATIDFISRVNKNDDRKLLFDNDSGTFRPFIEIVEGNTQGFEFEDEVEDVLQLLNSGLLQSIDGCDMRFGGFATLEEQRHLDAARQFIVDSLG